MASNNSPSIEQEISHHDAAFLRFFNPDYFITRNAAGELYVYSSEPVYRLDGEWFTELSSRCLNLKRYMPKVKVDLGIVTWESAPWRIGDLLNLEEERIPWGRYV